MLKKSEVTLFRLPKTFSYFEDRENWFVSRESGLSYYTDFLGIEAAEEAFHLTNAPQEYLNEDQIHLLKQLNFKGPSLSVGDIVRVESVVTRRMPSYFLCKSFGWEEFDGDRFKLLRFLS